MAIDPKGLGKWPEIAELATAKGLETQGELAHALRTSANVVSAWKKGKGPELAFARKLGAFFGVPYTRFLADEPPEPERADSRVDYDDEYPNRTAFLAQFAPAYRPEVLAMLRAMSNSVGDLSEDGWMRIATTLQAEAQGKVAKEGAVAKPPPAAEDAPLELRPGTANHARAVELLTEWGHGALLKKGVEIRWGAEGYNVGAKLVRWPKGYVAGKRGGPPEKRARS